jgi:hypothetical protein
MPKKIISFTMSENTISKVDKTSKALGMSRSEYVEKMLEKGFHFTDDIQSTVLKITKLQEQAKEKMNE